MDQHDQTKPKVRKRRFVKALAQGKTQKQAAIEAGYSPSRAEVTGCELAKDPEVQSNLKAILDKHKLGDDRIAKELDRGLTEATPDGKHGDYLDRLTELRGHTKSDKGSITNQILIVSQDATAQAVKDGIFPADA